VVPLAKASQQEERNVLHVILRSGIDQGCFLRPSPEHLASLTDTQQEALYAVLAERPEVEPPGSAGDASAPPDRSPIAGDEPGWAVLTQRCDLLRSYCTEPLVELARTTLVDSADANRTRLNSPRLVWLCDHDDDRCWVVDLRRRAMLPKHLLPRSTIAQPLADDRARKLFRHRVSQRYMRDPVPDDIVDLVQKPLKNALTGSTTRVELAGHFFAFLAVRGVDDVLLLALLDDDKPREQAEEAFGNIMERLKKACPQNGSWLAPESGVFTAGDVSLDLWLTSCKLSLDEISYGRRAGEGHAQPRV
jgi:hypothetical protein